MEIRGAKGYCWEMFQVGPRHALKLSRSQWHSALEGLFIAFPERYPGWGAFLKTFAWVSNTTLSGVPMLSEAVSAGDHRCAGGEPGSP